MKLAFGSDWHLDHLEDEQLIAFLKTVEDYDADAVIVSGDISEGKTLENDLISINNILTKPFYFVHGNHDFYYRSYYDIREQSKLTVEYLQRINWLELKSIQLKNKVALCGCDGWYDGGYGDYNKSPFKLYDFSLIDELKFRNQQERLKAMEAFADVGAAHIRRVLPELLAENDLVIFVTHVPPFREVCKYKGVPTDVFALPFFSSKIIGTALLDVARRFPKKEILVLCGHTHDEASFKFENINCVCASARYGSPSIYTTIEI